MDQIVAFRTAEIASDGAGVGFVAEGSAEHPAGKISPGFMLACAESRSPFSFMNGILTILGGFVILIL